MREAAIYPDTAGGAVNYIVEEIRESMGSADVEAEPAGAGWLVHDHDRQKTFYVDLRHEGAYTEVEYRGRRRDAEEDWTGLEGYRWTNEWWVDQYSPLLRSGGGERRHANPAWWGPNNTAADPDQTVALSDILAELDPLLDIACDAAYHDPYLYGMANGIIFVRSLISGRDPVYLDAPVAVREGWERDGLSCREAKTGFADARYMVLGDPKTKTRRSR